MPLLPQNPTRIFHSLIAFWVLGMCNNFAYVIMLSAAKDILATQQGVAPANDSLNDACQEKITRRDCSPISTGSVLLADILPALVVKVVAPFFMYRVPFGIRHLVVVLLQGGSFIVVANSRTVATGLAGVVIASAGSGLGEVTYLSLASYFSSRVVTTWSSGTGGAGVLGAFTYAALTDSHMLAMSPRTALLTMLFIPAVFAFTYWKVLILPSTVHRVSLTYPSTYLVPSYGKGQIRVSRTDNDNDEDVRLLDEDDERPVNVSRDFSFSQKLAMFKPLLRFMVPLSLVYFAEYFINQGLVLYQIGVFISRSSIDCFAVPISFLPLLPVLQLMNAAFFFVDTLDQIVPHIWMIFGLVFCEGLLGGCAYVNTFSAIHKSVDAEKREFSMGFASMSDSFGIVLAGFLAIPAHNFICNNT
ncbi:Battenin [Toxocara canis]|uniref:Battenin n=1 Tax=Toxocara canis TaxID=6265 RepID=A0A0B2VWK7_TOXCA|nr:Battenin [Toxocara canis]